MQGRTAAGRSRNAQILYIIGSILLTLAVFTTNLVGVHGLIGVVRNTARKLSNAVSGMVKVYPSATVPRSRFPVAAIGGVTAADDGCIASADGDDVRLAAANVDAAGGGGSGEEHGNRGHRGEDQQAVVP